MSACVDERAFPTRLRSSLTFDLGVAVTDEQRRRGRGISKVLVVGAVVVLGGAVTAIVWRSASTPSPTVAAPPTNTTSATPAVPTIHCVYGPSEAVPAGKAVGVPHDADKAPVKGTATLILKTDHGDITVTLDRAKAPCSVQSLLFLAEKKYYDGTSCSRLTAGDTFKSLTCGDASGTGHGTPGYGFEDRSSNYDLEPASPNQPDSNRIYPRGTVAMSNDGSGVNGAMFFIVYGDSELVSDYPVVGTADLTAVDQVAEKGLVPSADDRTDGRPKVPVTVQQAVVVR
jgi:peptidyl-prolyl cis-trans isomerase B (cyclophilin B)